jgi:DNA primase
MSGFVDFADVKARVSIEKAIGILGLKMTPHGVQYRGPCPACKAPGERTLVVTTGKELFYCFAARKGGDERRLNCRNNHAVL